MTIALPEHHIPPRHGRRAAVAVAGVAAALVLPSSALGVATSFEAERLPLSAAVGAPFDDPAARGGRGLLLWTSGAVARTTDRRVSAIAVRVRGDQCGGPPSVRITVNRRTVLTRNVTSASWITVRAPVPGSVLRGAGPNVAVTVAYLNDIRSSRCDRNLRLDWLSVASETDDRGATSSPVSGDPTPASPGPALPAPGPPTPSTPPASTQLPTTEATNGPPPSAPADAPVPPAPPAATPAPSRTARLFVDPRSPAALQAAAWRTSRPADAAQMDLLAAQPQAVWLGEWSGDVAAAARGVLDRAAPSGARVVFAVYDLPYRDCGQYSAGGLSATAYRAWIDALATAIGDHPALVVLEPDAVVLTDCLSAAARAERDALLTYAVHALSALPDSPVYLDAGHAGWKSASDVAGRLRQAGIDGASGFALNTSNFGTTDAQVDYGRAVSTALGGKPFVVDTSRNGLGPAPGGAWCNPAGRAIGATPTLETGVPGVDGFLWVKHPGESDGTCNGGPSAGTWWPQYALGLAANRPTR